MKEIRKKIINFYEGKPQLAIYLASAGLPMILIGIVWAIIGFYPFGSKSVMAVDFGQQYISFFGLLKNAVSNWDFSLLEYSFTKSIGGEMTGILAYYLLSPINLIYILVPFSHFHLAAVLTIWIRYGLIGLSFAHLLIQRYDGLTKKAGMVPIFATAYALSGMMVSYQMNPIFFDAMYMLPLVIIALEEVMDGGKAFKYILLLAATIIMQFYMGYMICIFIALYTLFYASPILKKDDISDSFKSYSRLVFRILGYSLLAVGITAFLLLPLGVNLSQSKGDVGSGISFSWGLQLNPLDILSKLIVGGFDAERPSWAAGPSLPNIYVGGLGLISVFFYYKVPSISKNKKIAALILSLIFFVSIVNEFVSKLWHMGQNPAGFFHRFSWIISFFILVIAFQVLTAVIKLNKKEITVSAIVAVMSGIYVYSQDYTFISKMQPVTLTEWLGSHQGLTILAFLGAIGTGIFIIWKKFGPKRIPYSLVYAGSLLLALFLFLNGYLVTQVSFTLLIWLLVISYLAFPQSKILMKIIMCVTLLELSVNAYLSQSKFAYPDAYKFQDATLSVKRVTDAIQESSDTAFYRIASNFNYSKTTPSLLNYPGLSTFSSSLERTTMDHFAYLGDVGVNAATNYVNGTPLTDALYGVRYYMVAKPYTTEESNAHPHRMYFNPNTSRTDIETLFPERVYEDERYIVYKNPNSYSIAFATDRSIQNIKFGRNNPIDNMSAILRSMSGTEDQYFSKFGFTAIELDNMVEAGESIYKRIDSSKPGIIRYKVIPKSSFTYYFLTPDKMGEFRGKVSILLNNKWLPNQQINTQRSMWQFTHNTEGEESVLEFRFELDEVNMTGAQLARSENHLITKVIEAKAQQNMTVDKWTNTYISGQVNVTDSSNIMMTSLPFDESWIITVDGKEVPLTKTLGSLISFPITSGQHKIEMRYQQRGKFLGSLLSIISLGYCYYLYKKETPGS